ncbi:MAG TPA: hypothetical protein VNH80_14055 [Burkholderiales bacterium]|nr:hypothetical protein [Burkholderiales bacterium]
MAPKTVALVVLGAISIASPAVEMAATGKVDPFGPYALADALVSLAPIFWWYHMDKQERNYRAGPLMNVGMVALTIVAMPVYFVRSRGWKRGTISSLLALVVFGATLALGELGEWLGGYFR